MQALGEGSRVLGSRNRDSDVPEQDPYHWGGMKYLRVLNDPPCVTRRIVHTIGKNITVLVAAGAEAAAHRHPERS